MANEKNVIHGEKIEINMDSVGMQFHEVLKRSKHSILFVDAFTNKTVSTEELFVNSCRLADSLRNYGLSQDDVIGVFSENCIEYFEPILAALYLGITVTLFNSYYTIDELKYTANLSKPKLLFCSKSTASTALATIPYLTVEPKTIIFNSDEAVEGCITLINFMTLHASHNFNINGFQPVRVNVKQQIAFILYSSGTTGLPKGVMLTNFNISAYFIIFKKMGNFKTKSTTIGLLPFFHTMGLFVILARLAACCKVVVMHKFEPYIYLKNIQDHKVTFIHIVPSIAHFLAKDELVNKFDLSHLKVVNSAGAPLSKIVEEALIKRFNIPKVNQSYGMTETTLAVLSPTAGLFRNGSSGTVLPNVSLKVVDVNTGESLGPLQSGELCCKGVLIMKGYVNDSESTKQAIDKEGWLHTGDIAYYDKDRVFYIVDRLKELIKHKGFQVAPAELEAVLLSHPDVLDSGVIGIPDERSGELPFAFVVKAPNSSLSEDELKAFVNEKVAVYKQLKGGIQFVPEIPRNPSGKILRRVLRQQTDKVKAKL